MKTAAKSGSYHTNTVKTVGEMKRIIVRFLCGVGCFLEMWWRMDGREM
jgi:hypothetical protein